MSRIIESVPTSRVRVARDLPPAPGDFVLYWMIANRRFRSNFALQRLESFAFVRADAGATTLVDLAAANPLAQRLRRAADLRGN